MHGLHSRYPEEKNKMIAVNHKLLEQVKVVAKEVNFHKHKLLDVRTCKCGRWFSSLDPRNVHKR